jgi:hypothetical protein
VVTTVKSSFQALIVLEKEDTDFPTLNDLDTALLKSGLDYASPFDARTGPYVIYLKAGK